MKRKHYFVDIDKESVRSKDTSMISALLRELESDPARNAQSIVLSFAYDDVPEEIFQIEEIREWVRLLFTEHPYFLYYACSNADTDEALLFCLCAEVSVFFKGEYISQDEYIRKYGKLDKLRTVIQVNGIGSILEKYMTEIMHYSIRLGIQEKGKEVSALLLDRWLKKLVPIDKAVL